MNTPKKPDIVADDVVVSLDYTLRVNGEIVDSTEGIDPFTYHHQDRSQFRHRLGVAVGLDEMATEEVQDEPVALSEVSLITVHGDPDHERRSGGQGDHHLVVAAIEMREELPVEPQVAKLPLGEEVRDLSRAPIARPFIVGDQGMVAHVSLEDLPAFRKGRCQRRLIPPHDAVAPSVDLVVGGELGSDEPGKLSEDILDQAVQVVGAVDPLEEGKETPQIPSRQPLHLLLQRNTTNAV